MFLLRTAGDAPTEHSVGARPFLIGRAPTNDLVVVDDTVSGRHAMVWVADEALFVDDLGSRNGTFVNDVRVQSKQALAPGDELRLGEATRFLVERVSTGAAEAWPLLEDLDAGLRYPLHADRLRIGPDARADVHVATARRPTTLLVHAHGEVWLGRDDEEREIAPEEVFEVGGRRFCVHMPTAALAATRELEATAYPYELRAALDGPVGGFATVTDRTTSNAYRVEADNRVALLYLLARKVLTDRAARVSADDRGWCADDDLLTGVWGRAAGATPNTLRVLVFRTRRELEAAGFDPWFLEKRRGYLRARVADASLA